ncbi:MAG: hypothetical protein H2052_17835, partial [Sphingosinicella sp.]|nr:hypothetical protein [Sphingosinicella sp.]
MRDAHGFNPDDFEWIPVARQPDAVPAALPAPPAVIPDIARALDALMPVCPPDPHTLIHPED